MSDQSKLSLRSLTIHRYEQFRNCPRIELSPDDNLILGINGSGKTSLLRLLAAVLRWNYDALLGQPFDIEFEQILDEGLATEASISGRVQYRPPLLGAEQQSQGRRAVRSKYEGFEARFDIHHSKWSLVVTVSDSMLRMDDGDSKLGPISLQTSWIGLELASVVPVSSADHLENDHPFLLAEHIHERAVATFVVRETELDFERLTEHIQYDFEVSPVHGGPAFHALEQLWQEPAVQQWFGLMYEVATRAAEQQNGHDFLVPVSYEREAGAGDRLDMSSLLAALDAERISFRPKIEKTESIGEGKRMEGRGIEIRVLFPSGTEMFDARLTFGQKRLITIALGALLCGGSPLLVDEIDNGLHPGLLETVLGLIQGRQTFIASHNKLVVDLLDYESPEDICRTIHICRRNQDGTQSLVALSDEQVREVFEKIEVGIMNPSDVLQREGLW